MGRPAGKHATQLWTLAVASRAAAPPFRLWHTVQLVPCLCPGSPLPFAPCHLLNASAQNLTISAPPHLNPGRYRLSPAAVHAVVQHSLAQVGLAPSPARYPINLSPWVVPSSLSRWAAVLPARSSPSAGGPTCRHTTMCDVVPRFTVSSAMPAPSCRASQYPLPCLCPAAPQVGLAEFAERPTSSLSGGQKQRVAIAGALAECPRVGADGRGCARPHETYTGRCIAGPWVTPALFNCKPAYGCTFRLGIKIVWLPSPWWVLYLMREPARLLPQVLLLDELTTFLDYEDQENVLQCVRRIVDSSRRQQGQQGQQQQPAAAAAAGGEGRGGRAAAPAAWEAGVTALWVTHRLEELDYADSVR